MNEKKDVETVVDKSEALTLEALQNLKIARDQIDRYADMFLFRGFNVGDRPQIVGLIHNLNNVLSRIESEMTVFWREEGRKEQRDGK